MEVSEVKGMSIELSDKLKNKKVNYDLDALYEVSYKLGAATLCLIDNNLKKSKLFKEIDTLKIKINNQIDDKLDKIYGKIKILPD